MSIRKNNFFRLALASALLCFACAGCSDSGDGSVYLYVDGNAAQVQNENGEVLQFADGQVTGELETLDIVSQSENGFMAEVASSGNFTFEGSGDKKVKYSVLSSLDRTEGTEYTLTGIGISSAAISPKGQIVVDGNKYTFEAFGSMRNGALGSYGNVRLSGMAEGSVELCFDEQNDTVSFDGTVPGLVLMTVNGDVSASSIAITDLDSGTISLTDLAGGTVTVTEKSGDVRTIPVDISLR